MDHQSLYFCQDKSWEERNEQANEDEEKEDWIQKRQDSLIFRLSKFEPAVCEQVDQGRGFRLRTSTDVVRLARPRLREEDKFASYKGEADSNHTGISRLCSVQDQPVRPSRSLRVSRQRRQVVKSHCACEYLVSGVEATPRPLECFAWLKFGLYRLIAGYLDLADFSLIGQAHCALSTISPQLVAQSNLVIHAPVLQCLLRCHP